MKITTDAIKRVSDASDNQHVQTLKVIDGAGERLEKIAGDLESLKLHYNPQIFKHIGDSGFEIVSNVFIAIEERLKKRKVLSIRELDIAARAGFDLKTSNVIESMFIDDFFLCEGIVGDVNSPWECRSRYNRGLVWFKENNIMYNPIANQCALNDIESRAFRIMDQMYHELCSHSLKPWPHEISHGFDEIFLIPEFMSAKEYSEKRLKNLRLFDL